MYGCSNALKKSGNLGLTFTKTILLSFGLLAVASVWWFFYEIDGFSQVIGIGYYEGSFLVINLINAVILMILKKKQKLKTNKV